MVQAAVIAVLLAWLQPDFQALAAGGIVVLVLIYSKLAGIHTSLRHAMRGEPDTPTWREALASDRALKAQREFNKPRGENGMRGGS
jgi:hypothetical protein